MKIAKYRRKYGLRCSGIAGYGIILQQGIYRSAFGAMLLISNIDETAVAIPDAEQLLIGIL